MSRRPALAALLSFAVTLAPFIWITQRMSHEARMRDYDRLNELRDAVRDSLSNESTHSQNIMQTWRARIAAMPVLDENSWAREVTTNDEWKRSHFRAVGCAVWSEAKLIVRFTAEHSSGESIAAKTDLAALPEVGVALEHEKKLPRGALSATSPFAMPGIGERVVTLTSWQRDDATRGVVFALLVATDFLESPEMSRWRINDDGSLGTPTQHKRQLPGVQEGYINVASVSGEERERTVATHAFASVLGLKGPMGELNLVFTPGPKFKYDQLADESWLALGAGLIVATLLGALVWMQVRQRAELQRQVESRTAELRQTNLELGRFKAIAETTSDFVGMCELDGTPTYVNQAGRAMLGIELDEPIHLFEFERIYSPQAMALFESEGFAHAMEKGPWSCDLDLRHSDGRDIPVSFVGFVVKSPDGRPLHMGSMARDISVRQQLDQQLRASLDQQRELVRLKSQFVNTVSHEFRTPLGIILTSADILTHYLDRLPQEERLEHLQDIHRASKDMSRMLEQVLDLGRIDAGKLAFAPHPVDLAALLHRITDESLSASSGPQVSLCIEGDLSNAHADESLLRHIFLNLLSNARKYSPANSEVAFDVRRDRADAIFTVHDHGIGIPAADLANLFEAFARGTNVGDTPGTGLGLAIVKRCVELHNGSIEITSEPNIGTEVTVRLPLFQIINHQS